MFYLVSLAFPYCKCVIAATLTATNIITNMQLSTIQLDDADLIFYCTRYFQTNIYGNECKQMYCYYLSKVDYSLERIIHKNSINQWWLSPDHTTFIRSCLVIYVPTDSQTWSEHFTTTLLGRKKLRITANTTIPMTN